jgi:hypothetical protein
MTTGLPEVLSTQLQAAPLASVAFCCLVRPSAPPVALCGESWSRLFQH